MNYWWEEHDDEGLVRAVASTVPFVAPVTPEAALEAVRANPRRPDENALQYAVRIAELAGLTAADKETT